MRVTEEASFTYVGGPTLVIDFGGIRFLVDPTFDPGGGDYTTGPVTLSKTMGPAVPASSLGRIDAVLLSHDHHFDNLDRAGRELLPAARVVLTILEGAGRLEGNAVGLSPWQQHMVQSADAPLQVRITATPARHGAEGSDRGPVIGFVLEREGVDGAIYISGDTVWFDGVAQTLRRFPNITVAVLFMGAAQVSISPAHLTFTAEEAIQVAQTLPHCAIVPVHYEGWKHFNETRQETVQVFTEAGLENRLKWLPAGEATLIEV